MLRSRPPARGAALRESAVRRIAVVAALAVVVATGGAVYRAQHVRVPLHADVVLIRDGERILVPPGSRPVLPFRSRIDPVSRNYGQELARERVWLRSVCLPVAPGDRYYDAAVSAVLDLRVLTLENGASVAAWSPYWRFVWPRDSAFVVAALSALGQVEDARRILSYVQRMQSPDGLFEARYLPDASGTAPDRRGIQRDGTGWSLWALARWLDAVPPGRRAEAVREFAPLLDRSLARMATELALPPHMPAVSSDYWEVDEDELTLGTAGAWLVGLTAAEQVLRDVDAGRAARVARWTQALRGAVHERFGPRFPRYASSSKRDAAVAFLLPPFLTGFERDAGRAWRRAAEGMRRPAGGLAPGEGWKRDGISWTPQTALFALTAASLGDRERASRWLDWLVDHRTRGGSFPEKVLSNGDPAGPAPLAWTSAVFLLALQALDGDRRRSACPRS